MSLPSTLPPVRVVPLNSAGFLNRLASASRRGRQAVVDFLNRCDVAAFLVSAALHALAVLTLAWIVVAVGPRPVAGPIVIAAAADEGAGVADLDGLTMPIDAPLAAASSGGPAEARGGAPAVEELEAAEFEAADPLGPREEMLDPAALLGKVGVGRGSGAAGRGDVEAEFYGLKARGRRFVFVADCSGSMLGPALNRLKRELRATIRRLPADAEFFVVFFNHTAVPMAAVGPVPATPRNKGRHIAWVSKIAAEGGTDPSAALAIALRMEPTTVFLMTDGVFLPEPVLATIARLNEGGSIQIHTIAVGAHAAQPVLRRIAEENDGQFQAVDR